MGKSQETFNKKEKEKQRLKKRKEKEERKEERKENSAKGLSLEDMMAYVDEDGNITSTPPTGVKKKTINQEDIQIGVAKQVSGPAADPIKKGKVTFFNESKGYGFIRDLESQESVFVHMKALKTPIKENDKVTFEVEKTPKGPNAINVRKE